MKVSYDPNLRLKLWPLSRARTIIHETAKQSDIFLPSLDDASVLTGLDNPEEIVDYYLELGVKLVVLKICKDGALLANEKIRERIGGFKVDTVDATGAGDTFDGAFIAKLNEGVSLTDAARYATVAAALSTTDKGAVNPIPNRDTVEEFLSRV